MLFKKLQEQLQSLLITDQQQKNKIISLQAQLELNTQKYEHQLQKQHEIMIQLEQELQKFKNEKFFDKVKEMETKILTLEQENHSLGMKLRATKIVSEDIEDLDIQLNTQLEENQHHENLNELKENQMISMLELLARKEQKTLSDEEIVDIFLYKLRNVSFEKKQNIYVISEEFQMLMKKILEEKMDLKKDLYKLYKKLVDLKKNLKMEKEFRHQFEIENQHQIQEIDHLNDQIKNLRIQNQDDEITINELKRQIKESNKKNIQSQDDNVNSFLQQIEKLTNEIENKKSQINQLQIKNIELENEKEEQSEMMVLLKEKTELEEQIDQLQIKYENALEEKDKMVKICEDQFLQLKELKESFANELNMKELEKINILRERDNLLKSQKFDEQLNKGRGSNLEPLSINLSNYQDYSMKEDQDNSELDVSQDDIQQQNNSHKLERKSLFLTQANEKEHSNLLNELERDNEYGEEKENSDINYLIELQEKDEKIMELRQELLNLKEKMNNMNFLEARKVMEENSRFQLRINHLEQDLQLQQEQSSKQILILQKEVEELEILIVQIKLNYQHLAEKKSNQQIKQKKLIKELQYTISLYEDQIKTHNSMISIKQLKKEFNQVCIIFAQDQQNKYLINLKGKTFQGKNLPLL